MAGLGAFLLVAAAATFVAVRWDEIPAGVKLAALVAMTLACLQAHLRLRPSLPVTAMVLLHLGVLLVPIDVAALGVRFGWDWPTMLLAEGITATVVFGVAARAEDSVVLRAATWLGVVLLAGGIGGLTVVPAGLVLAGVALAAVTARHPAQWMAARRPGSVAPSPVTAGLAAERPAEGDIRAGAERPTTADVTARAQRPATNDAGAEIQPRTTAGIGAEHPATADIGTGAESPATADDRAQAQRPATNDAGAEIQPETSAAVGRLATGDVGAGAVTRVGVGQAGVGGGWGKGVEDLWAAGWALLAGLAMPLAGAEGLGVPGAHVLADLGLTGEENAVAAGVTGLVAGVVLGVVGGRRRSLPAALAGIGCVLAGATTAWVNLGPDSTRPEQLDVPTALMAMAALGLLAELAAWSCRADPFWWQPTGIVAGLGELAASVVTVSYVGIGLSTPLDVEPSPEAALAAALISLTWLAATARRTEPSPPLAMTVASSGTPAPTGAPARPGERTATAVTAAPAAEAGDAGAALPHSEGLVPPADEAAATRAGSTADPGTSEAAWMPPGTADAGRPGGLTRPGSARPDQPGPGSAGRLASPAAMPPGTGARPTAAWTGDEATPTPHPVTIFGPVAAAVAACAAVALATGSGLTTAWALTVFGGAVVLGTPRLLRDAGTSVILAVGLLSWAPALTYLATDDVVDSRRLLLVAGLGLAGAVIAAASVVTTTSSPRRREPSVPPVLLGIMALLPLAVSAGLLGIADEGTAAASLGIVGVWLVAAILDLADLGDTGNGVAEALGVPAPPWWPRPPAPSADANDEPPRWQRHSTSGTSEPAGSPGQPTSAADQTSRAQPHQTSDAGEPARWQTSATSDTGEPPQSPGQPTRAADQAPWARQQQTSDAGEPARWQTSATNDTGEPPQSPGQPTSAAGQAPWAQRQQMSDASQHRRTQQSGGRGGGPASTRARASAGAEPLEPHGHRPGVAGRGVTAPAAPTMPGKVELRAGALTTAVRAASLVPLALTLALVPVEAAAVAGLAAALALLDALRRNEPWLILGTGVATSIVAGGLALDQGTSLAEAGLAVTLIGVAWLGLAGSLPRRWAPPALVSAVLAGGAGFVLCIEDRATTASYLLVAGTALAAAGVAVVQRPLVAAGAALTTIGFWSHLSLAEVTASEPYIAPAALLALAAGISARQRSQAAAEADPTGSRPTTGGSGLGSAEPVSSWIAFAPPVALLGGAALAERLAGGPAWHAIVAGGVGIVAVAAGGMERLAGPLLVGTLLVVGVTVHETLGVTAHLPTWVWLGSGGALLLAAGIAMERRDTGPVQTGKRLVDLVRDQFT